MEQEERLKDFGLEGGRRQRYLRTSEPTTKSKVVYVRDTPQENFRKFKEFETHLNQLDFQPDQIETIYKILAAILLLGELKFKNAEGTSNFAELQNPELATEISNLLKLDDKKFNWALLNYCIVAQGHAERRRHSTEEAKEARDALANNIFTRLVDYIVNTINSKMAFSRAM